jgi:ribosome assembly protein RRB1
MPPKGKKGRKKKAKKAGKRHAVAGDARLAAESEVPDGPMVQYEDPFDDEYEAEEMLENDEGLMVDDDEDDEGGPARMFRPGVDQLNEGEVLEFDPSAYVMYHALRAEWPSLSFDILR